jgi:copper chaperone CopZ
MTTTFVSEDISCEGCASSIKKAVGALPGVTDVSVEVDSQRITVIHEESVSRETLVSALDKAGFETT